MLLFSLFTVIYFPIYGAIDPQLLNCNFDKGTFCNWQPDSNLWSIVDSVSVDAFQVLLRPKASIGSFACTRRRLSNPSESRLTSPPLEPLRYSTKLQYSYWKLTSDPRMDVCLLEVNNELICLHSISGAGSGKWIKNEVIIPPLEAPTRIVIQVRNINSVNDIIAIDDLFFDINPFPGLRNDEKLQGVPQSTNAENIRHSIGGISWSDEVKRTDKHVPTDNILSDASCKAVRCYFSKSTCSWQVGPNWREISGAITIDCGDVSDIMISDAFVPPLLSAFEMDVWMSENVKLTVTEIAPTADIVIWSRLGLNGEHGWKRLRIPLRTFSYPIRIQIRVDLSSKGLISIANTKLVNKNGYEVNCGSDYKGSSVNNLEIERLTAYQQIQNKKNMEISTFSPTVTVSEVIYKIRKIDPAKSLISTRPTAFSSLYQSENNMIPQPFLSTIADKANEVFINTPIPQNLIKSSNMWLGSQLQIPLGDDVITHKTESGMEKIIPMLGTVPTASNSDISLERFSNISGLSSIFSRISGQPVMEVQLRKIAKQLGFDRLSAEQGMQLIKRLMNAKAPSDWLSLISNGNPVGVQGQEELRPIKPVNVPTAETQNSFTDHLNLRNQDVFSSIRNVNGEILKQFATILSPPRSHNDYQSPLTRQNLDFIVKNAKAANT